MLYLAEALLLLVGLYYLAKNNSKVLKLIIAWVLIVPLATMLLGQTHALRNNLMIPPLLLVSGYALSKMSVKFVIVLLTLIIIQLVAVLNAIYFFAPNKFGSFWSSEAKKVVLETLSKGKDQQIILSTKIDNMEYAYPVYAKVDPIEVISQYGKMPKVYGNVTISDK